MLIKVNSIAYLGLDCVGIDVEVNISSRGFPSFDIVGLPNKAVAESRERVKTALQNSGFEFPNKQIMINLAPADIPKDGSFYDLPIAIGIVFAVREMEPPEGSLFFGELSLDGSLRHTRGAFLLALYAKDNGFKSLYIPKHCVNEVKFISDLNVYSIDTLTKLIQHFAGLDVLEPFETVEYSSGDGVGKNSEIEIENVVGQAFAKRALEISAAGGHNVLLYGSPGAGKTMLARAYPSILPPLSYNESLEVTKIYSASGKIPPEGSIITQRQFRAPHHTVSYAGLIGGGANPRPGEISLSHRGVLFMDEFSEFSRQALESLRQPLESGYITITRSRNNISFPAKFILIAASNPCPCGYYGHPKKQCTCTPAQVQKYQKKLSGPLLDRIDLHVHVQPVESEKLKIHDLSQPDKERSGVIRQKVLAAREIQRERFKNDYILTNSEMSNKLVSTYCPLTPDSEKMLSQVINTFNLSARAYIKLVKISRTIADLDNCNEIKVEHVAEAVQYRTRMGES